MILPPPALHIVPHLMLKGDARHALKFLDLWEQAVPEQSPAANSALRKADKLAPEKDLYLAVLIEGLFCMAGIVAGANNGLDKKHETEKAWRWFLSDEPPTQEPQKDGVRVTNICRLFGIPVKSLRKQVEDIGPHQLAKLIKRASRTSAGEWTENKPNAA